MAVPGKVYDQESADVICHGADFIVRFPPTTNSEEIAAGDAAVERVPLPREAGRH